MDNNSSSGEFNTTEGNFTAGTTSVKIGLNVKRDIRVEGAEPHNCSTLVSLGEADLAVAGFDELLTTTQEKLINPSTVTKWGAYNYNF